jgi:hypothetical protein
VDADLEAIRSARAVAGGALPDRWSAGVAQEAVTRPRLHKTPCKKKPAQLARIKYAW